MHWEKYALLVGCDGLVCIAADVTEVLKGIQNYKAPTTGMLMLLHCLQLKYQQIAEDEQKLMRSKRW